MNFSVNFIKNSNNISSYKTIPTNIKEIYALVEVPLKLRLTYISSILYNHLYQYPTPKNITYGWSFGALSGLCLLIQIVTGLFLAMHYIPESTIAHDSVDHIMREVCFGSFIRYAHANGASMFFFMLFFHISKGLFFSSYLKPRFEIWTTGILLFFLVMATAFLGYVLPWGQMSLWGATVITNLFSAIPIFGNDIVELLWGGFSVAQPTLNRFYTLHFLLPFIIVGVTFLHLTFLHKVGSSDPVGLDSNKNYKNPAVVTFFPYFVVKDTHCLIAFLCIFGILIFIFPNALGHPDNYILANLLVTPEHIVPEWYFLPFYAILRSVPNKLLGVLAMGLSIASLLLFFIYIPSIKSPIFRKFYTITVILIIITLGLLGIIGQEVAEEPYVTTGRICSIFYFILIFGCLPIITFFSRIDDLLLQNINVKLEHILSLLNLNISSIKSPLNLNYLIHRLKSFYLEKKKTFYKILNKILTKN